MTAKAFLRPFLIIRWKTDGRIRGTSCNNLTGPSKASVTSACSASYERGILSACRNIASSLRHVPRKASPRAATAQCEGILQYLAAASQKAAAKPNSQLLPHLHCRFESTGAFNIGNQPFSCFWKPRQPTMLYRCFLQLPRA